MYENMILSGRILRFSEIDFPVVTKTYWKYKKEYIYIYIYIYIYMQNNIFKTYLSSAAQQSTS